MNKHIDIIVEKISFYLLTMIVIYLFEVFSDEIKEVLKY